MVRCEPIAVAGVLPKWACGSGLAFILYQLYVEPETDHKSLQEIQAMQRNFRETYDQPLEAAAFSEFLRLVHPPSN
jgi:hypothetical protein